MRRLILPLLLLTLSLALGAQSSLLVNGMNEAKFTYRTAPDSLNAYFRDSFSFNLGYRNFRFGMKFIAELPKYSTSQSELLDELSADRLNLGWKELHASYAKDAYLIHAGTIEETFGSGIVFRSFEDLEFDQDNRVSGFKFAYDDALRLKALYSGIPNPGAPSKLDLAYGLDAEYPVWQGFTLGGSALAMRDLTPFNTYSQNDVFGGRLRFQSGPLETTAEYSQRELYRRGMGLASLSGSALYGTLALSFSPLQFGGAYKRYDQFQYRLQDLPLANYHNETLADNQGSGIDEEGFQAWTNLTFIQDLVINLDYAEAWNQAKTMRMNDAYFGLDWTQDNLIGTLSYSHVEKVDNELSHWQKETYPGFNLGFPAGRTSLVLSGEFKTVEKQSFDLESSHYEPKLQADVTLGKLALSVGAQSWWEDFSAITDSRYWANLEAKYPILSGTDLVFFAGKEAGGKVCRNGVCRYVAPFSGLRLELNTRF
ncbi:MAG: hypothetical protein K0B87_03740 [Candidatus Syntrophosphaera sp.]|nr:hypothetical protein [Candidatus Syntrophosphaera sp.]